MACVFFNSVRNLGVKLNQRCREIPQDKFSLCGGSAVLSCFKTTLDKCHVDLAPCWAPQPEEWAFWSECDRSCGGGQKTRERSVTPADAPS